MEKYVSAMAVKAGEARASSIAQPAARGSPERRTAMRPIRTSAAEASSGCRPPARSPG